MSTGEGSLTGQLRAFVEGRTRYVLALGGINLVVLAAGLGVAAITGYVAYAALAAAWMFLAIRISRFVVGDRRRDGEAQRRVQQRRLDGQGPGEEAAEALTAAREHRRAILGLSGGAVAAILLGLLGPVLPSIGAWFFGAAAAYVVAGLGWAWSRRRGWAEARARVDAWAASDP